ncbi:MAG: hypothetical protein AAF993_01705 [Pseudomonadota bacterium]
MNHANLTTYSIRQVRRQAGLLTLLVMLLTPAVAQATTRLAAEGMFIDVMPKNKAEVELILETLENSINTSSDHNLPPIVMMLHGEEAHRFVRGNYTDNKDLVDQTAKLAAYGILDVKICETWMRGNNYTAGDLFPFVTGVPLGTAEVERLAADEGYVEYSVSM